MRQNCYFWKKDCGTKRLAFAHSLKLKEGKNKREYYGDFSFILTKTLVVFSRLVLVEHGHALEKLLKQGMFAFIDSLSLVIIVMINRIVNICCRAKM